MINMKEAVISAEKRIQPYVRETVLEFSFPLSKITDTQVYLKCETQQYTGAFKVRGAFSKILSLSSTEQKKGIVAASTGNHGAAVAYAINHLKLSGKIYVPQNASPTKIDNILNYHVPLELHGNDCVEAEVAARAYANEHHMVYVSPYNDPDVIAGQGTIGLELTRQLKDMDAIFVPVGGGGLISGIAGYIKAVSPRTKVYGCLPINSPVMAESIQAGNIIDMKTFPTLSDATAGNIEHNSITFEYCKAWVDDYFLVSEQEIKHALVTLIKTQHILAEGAAGVALASLLKHSTQFKNQKVVVLLSGANISVDVLKDVLHTEL